MCLLCAVVVGVGVVRGETSFSITIFPPMPNASSADAVCEVSNSTEVEFKTGCQQVNGHTVQFDCTEHGELRAVMGYADRSCEVEASGGYTEGIVERHCTALSVAEPLLSLIHI